MLFSSLLFLFLFLPLVIPLSLIPNTRIQNYFLLIASLVFYAWGGISYTLIMIISILMNYLFGILIENKQQHARLILTLGIILNIGMLCVFKYLSFLVLSLNSVLPKSYSVPQVHIALPIGISFFTFHGLSYIIDVYRKKFNAQKDLSILALYITLFPQLIAGPIIRYKDIYAQFLVRKNSSAKFAYGIKRFIIGLGKKVIIANTFASIADKIFALDPGSLNLSLAWLGIISYAIQIYFDFSGYSDMAIGIGRMFGFKFPENFNLPYIAQSIQEFWRRWHISLSTWFRDYLYIPLGGNQASAKKTFRNLITVFFLCGLWHGASWTFVIWGLYHGLFLVVERLGLKKILDRTWKPLRHLYTLLVVLIGWVFFRADTFEQAFSYTAKLFSFAGNKGFAEAAFYINSEVLLYLIIALIFSTALPKKSYLLLKKYTMQMPSLAKQVFNNLQYLFSNVSLLCIFILCVLYLATSSYNPFIYFRF
ncbi:MAG: MBOAT family protein [Bacteroidetes bacterium]|nr:MBOAT family protein [Bacteroidota bacterium]